MLACTCAQVLLLVSSYHLLAKVGFCPDFGEDFFEESIWLKYLLACNTFLSNLPGWQLF